MVLLTLKDKGLNYKVVYIHILLKTYILPCWKWIIALDQFMINFSMLAYLMQFKGSQETF